MSKIYQLLIAGVLICASSIQAQPHQTEILPDTLQLDDIIITATKIPVSMRETARPVLMIDRQEIEQSSGRDLSQLLNQQSGIRVNNVQGTPSGNQSLFLQGAGGEYALILIDGMPVRDPSGVGGVIDMRLLPKHQIERVEVLKGNQSALYGTDAVAGVINIISKSSSEKKFESNGTVSYGSYNSFNGSVGVNGSLNDRVSYRLNTSRESSEGISAAADPTGEDNFESDGFSHQSFYGGIDFKPFNRFTISSSLHYSDYDGDYDADAFLDAPNSFQIKMFNPSLQARFQSERFTVNSSYNYSKTDRLFSHQFGEDEYEGRFHNLDNFTTYRLNNYLNLLGGLNYQTGEMPSLVEGENSHRTSFISPYATILVRNLYGLSAEIGYRLNSHSEYGENSSFNFSPSYRLAENTKLFASYGTGFKAPTLNELFGPFGPNPDLEPEKSSEYRFGIESYFMDQSLKLSAHYFNREIENLIVFTFDPGYINRDREKTEGFDVNADWLISRNAKLGLYYNYLTGETITLDDAGNQVTSDGLIRKPANQIGFHASYRFSDAIFMKIDGEMTGERTDLFFNPENNFAAEEVSLDSFFLLNLYAEYSLLNQQLVLFVTIRNLLNTEFTEVYGFNTMGIHGNGGVRFRF
jgi:vitamin B12 transporter